MVSSRRLSAAPAGASFARCSRSFVTPRYGFGAAIRGIDAIDRYDAIRDLCKLLNVGGVPVARCKQSAPAKHPARGAEYANGV